MNSKLTENINNQKDSLEQSSIENKVLEGSIDSNYDLCFFNLGPKFMSDSIFIYKIYKNNKFKVIFFTLKLRKTLVFFYIIMYL